MELTYIFASFLVPIYGTYTYKGNHYLYISCFHSDIIKLMQLPFLLFHMKPKTRYVFYFIALINWFSIVLSCPIGRSIHYSTIFFHAAKLRTSILRPTASPSTASPRPDQRLRHSHPWILNCTQFLQYAVSYPGAIPIA